MLVELVDFQTEDSFFEPVVVEGETTVDSGSGKDCGYIRREQRAIEDSNGGLLGLDQIAGAQIQVVEEQSDESFRSRRGPERSGKINGGGRGRIDASHRGGT